MGKISIGLRGWRFDEEEVFTEEGELRPLEELSEDTRKRLVRLQDIADSICDGCWLIHGDENPGECNPAEAVYGEPVSEVILCAEHEQDLIYWFREEGGDRYIGDEEFRDAFHEWFLDGGRAPEDYEGIEHVETDPDDLPEPPEIDDEARKERWETTDRKEMRDEELDLSQEYPGGDD